MVLIEVRNASGKVTRRCDGRCHGAKPLPRGKRSHCVCGGIFRGLTYNGGSALNVPTALLAAARENVELRPGESIQLRIGA
jgi:hypothetical protein